MFSTYENIRTRGSQSHTLPLVKLHLSGPVLRILDYVQRSRHKLQRIDTQMQSLSRVLPPFYLFLDKNSINRLRAPFHRRNKGKRILMTSGRRQSCPNTTRIRDVQITTRPALLLSVRDSCIGSHLNCEPPNWYWFPTGRESRAC